jgi:phosphoglycolate phosphatase
VDYNAADHGVYLGGTADPVRLRRPLAIDPRALARYMLDGTLCDTLDDIAAAANHALAAFALPVHAAADYVPLIGEGAANLIRRAMPADRLELHAEALARFRAYYADHLVVKTRLYEGISELLDAVSARGIAMAILSNKPDPATNAIADRLLSRWRWAAVHGERAGVPRKPDPTAALSIAGSLAVSPAECAIVGDGETDMRTAVGAGMLPIGAAWGFRTIEALRAAGAARIAAEPADVLPLVA